MQLASTINTNPSLRRLSILGSTGSIGCNTLDVISQHRERYEIVALTAQDNVHKLIEQALAFTPDYVAIGNAAHYETLKQALTGTKIEIGAGAQAIEDAATFSADWIMAAIVGSAGLKPTLNAIAQGTHVALANKECLVCAGELMQATANHSGATLLPVDSEHNAIFQLFDTQHAERVTKVVLTASGGPFREYTIEQLQSVTPAQAVKHPNWSMGAKISVDSATLMNKGLELIEAYHLFPLKPEQLDVVVHPESIIHSMVYYCDGSVLAQMAAPDMRIPIAHTLGWPERLKLNTTALDLTRIGTLHFEAPDESRFPCLALAKAALNAGNSATITLNAANEIAVESFLNGVLRFMDIATVVEETLNQTTHASAATLEEIVTLDALARQTATHIAHIRKI